MNTKFQKAFDNIKADTQLKDNTYDYLRNEILKRQQRRIKFFKIPKVAYITVTCIILCLFCLRGYSIYFEEVSFVSIDINPSIELTLNRFDKVLNAKAYNKDGKQILSSVDIKNKDYNEALKILVTNEMLNKYIEDNAYISFTVSSNDIQKQTVLIDEFQNCAKDFIYPHHNGTYIECSVLNSELKDEAHSHDMSLGKYKAFLELQQVNPSVTIEECKHKSMHEIKTEVDFYLQDSNTINSINTSNSNNINNNTENNIPSTESSPIINPRGCHHRRQH